MSYWTPNPRRSRSFAPVPSTTTLDPVTLTCLDALLVLGQVDSSTPLRQLLEDAQITQSNGRVYSAAAIRKALDAVPDLVTKSSYGAGYSIPLAARIALLGQRATQDNTTLRQLALSRYRSTKASQRGYYYNYATVEPVLLAVIADDPAAFRDSLADLARALQGNFLLPSRYRSPRSSFAHRRRLTSGAGASRRSSASSWPPMAFGHWASPHHSLPPYSISTPATICSK